jgi:hypothetical protein
MGYPNVLVKGTAAVMPTASVPVTASNVYADGDVIGAAFEVGPVVGYVGASAVLQSLVLYDHDSLKPAMDILFFDRNPNIPGTDAAFDLNSAVESSLVGRVTVAALDWVTYTDASCVVKSGIGQLIRPLTGYNIWCACIARSAFTGSDNTFSMRLGVLN